MMHGKTKIELYNPNTKIKQIIREENTFQSSVLADYLRSLGEANNNPFANSNFASAKPWTNLVGGIFLFKDAIDLTGGVVKYMPAGNRMIGNGAYQVANGNLADDPTEMGSWNDSESSASASAITQVYDFATNQANGTIGCVCLTSQTGGYIGYGNESGKVKAGYDFKRNQNTKNIDATNTAFGNSTVVGNIKYSFAFADGNLIVRKTRATLTQGSIFDGFYTESSIDLSSVGNHLGVVSQSCIPMVDGTNIYLIPAINQSVASNGTAYFYKFNTTNDELTEIAFVNISSKMIYIYGITSGWGQGVEGMIANGLLFARNTDNKTSVFDLSTGIYKDELDLGTGSTTVPQRGRNVISSAPNGLVFARDTSGFEYIYDTVTGACRKTNGSSQTVYVGSSAVVSYDSLNDAMVYQSGIYLYKCPLYLATVNNLQSPVTKTAAQTMKVTYTLTEE